MTRIEFWSAVMGLLVAIVVMFNQINGRLDTMQAENQRQHAETNRRFDAMHAETNRRFDAMHAETNRRFDTMQAENQRQHDALQAEMNQMRTEMNRRFDTMQAENQRQHDAIEEVLRVFEGRITRLEEQAGGGPEPAE